MPDMLEQIGQLEAAIRAQEVLRPTLGDMAVDAVVAALRDMIQSLRARQQPPAPAPDELLARLIPKELAAKMRATGRIEGERKQVTVLFADLSGYTPLSERLDPEVVMQLSQDLLKELAEVVYQYEGYITDFLGDAIMAIFGAPITHEDDAERALRAALAMRERIAGLSRRWETQVGQALELHIGINTGAVVTGTVGSDLRMSYAVQGDTVNTAQRVQSAARRGQILVGRETYRLTREAFTFVALDPITVKGKREPLAVFELQHAKLLPEKSRGLSDLGSAFEGRADALAQLRAVIGELEAGRGRIVSLTGEAGIGKSRLLSEWRKEVGDRAQWAEGHAFAHTTSLAYGPFVDMLRRFARIKDEDSEAEARARLDAAIERLLPDSVEAHGVFANLLGMRLPPDEATMLAAFPAEALRRRMFALIQQIFERLAQAQPTLLIIEDLHWADPSSLDLFASLLPLTERLPLALVGVRRSEANAAPSALRQIIEAHYAHRFTDVALTRLSESASLSMVEQLLSTSAVPAALQAIILGKAEGNPFFVEEVIRVLIEHGALTKTETGWVATPLSETITVPDTVQGVLMARLDALPDETKSVAQQASVVGRIFLYRVLRHMAEHEASVETDLTHLAREDLIRERARVPEMEYSFKHALTQEVAYQSLLTPRRKQLHRKAGEALEAIFVERLGEVQGIIGEHFLKGETWDKAADYLIKAGDAATRLNAHAEARVHFVNALEALSRLPDDEALRRRRVDTIIKQVTVSWLSGGPAQNLTLLANANSLMATLSTTEPQGREDRLRLARIQYAIGRAHYIRGEGQQAMAHFRQVLTLAADLGDDELIALPSRAIGSTLGFQGRWSEAEPFLRQALVPLERLATGFDWVLTVSFLGMILAGRGHYRQGLAELERAAARARQVNHPSAIAAAHILLAMACLEGDDIPGMKEASLTAVQMAEQAGDQLFVHSGSGLLAWAESLLANPESARTNMARSQAVGRGLGPNLLMADWFATANVELALNAHRVEEAIQLAEQAVQIARTADGIFAEGRAHRGWGQALVALDPPRFQEAQAHFAESLRLCAEGDARLEAARTHLAWGNVCRAQGEHADARAHYEQAAAQFEVSGLTDELESIRQSQRSL